VAVDQQGYVLTATEPASGKGAWQATAVVPGRAILAVSCASVALCVAVDEDGDVLSSTEPAGGAGAWHTVEVVKGIAIDAVSCVETMCVAVDEDGGALSSTAPAGGANTWSVAHLDDYPLRAVSCASAALCVATDTNGDVLAASEPDGPASGWSVAQVDTLSSPPLAAVACASATLCVASGGGSLLTSTQPAADGPSAWKTEPSSIAGPSVGLACLSASLCVGVAEASVQASTAPASGAPSWSVDAAWAYPPNFRPQAEYFGPIGAVSCASGALCVAAGDSYNDYHSLLTSTNPAGGEAQWHTVASSQMEGTGNQVSPPYTSDPILGVSCATTSLCVAVDAAGNVLTSTNAASTDSTWLIAPVVNQPLDGISCPAENLCVAVDAIGDVVYSTNPTAGSSAWTVSDIDGPRRLTAVSCAPGSSLCVAADDEGNVLVASDPTGAASTWNATDVDSTEHVSRALTAVSCVSAGICVAIDDAGYAVTGTFAALVEQHEGGEGPGQPITPLPTGGAEPPASKPKSVSKDFKIHAVRVKHNGHIVLKLQVPGPGSVAVRANASTAIASCRRHTKRRRNASPHSRSRCRRIRLYGKRTVTVSKAQMISVLIKPSSRARKALDRSHRLRVSVVATFTPTGTSKRQTSRATTIVASVRAAVGTRAEPPS
jgi:hypothetical protein